MSPAPRAAEAAYSLVELMVAMVASSLIIALTFGIYTSITRANVTQTSISDTQQTVRSAQSLIAADLRMAGFAIRTLKLNDTGASGFRIQKSLEVDDDHEGAGPDLVKIFYADSTQLAHIVTGPPANPFQSAESKTRDGEGPTFTTGDVLVAVNDGDACVLLVTNVQDGGAGFDLVQHRPSAPFNDAANQQCDDLADTWDDGKTRFMRFVAHAYRINPDSSEGVLQRSPSGMVVADDWEDLAIGVEDLQLALHYDSDGDGTADTWFNDDQMESAVTDASKIASARMTLVARTRSTIPGWVAPDAANPWGAAGIENHDVNWAADDVRRGFVWRKLAEQIELRNLRVR